MSPTSAHRLAAGDWARTVRCGSSAASARRRPRWRRCTMLRCSISTASCTWGPGPLRTRLSRSTSRVSGTGCARSSSPTTPRAAPQPLPRTWSSSVCGPHRRTWSPRRRQVRGCSPSACPRGSRVLVIGGPGVGDALRERGLVPVESVDDGAVALMQGYGPDVDWRQLAEGSLAIGRGLLWVATNLDRTIPSPRGRVLGNGSMVAALRHASGAEPLVAGKPEPPLMLESVERSAAVRPTRGGGSARHRHRGRQPFGDPLVARAHGSHRLAGPARCRSPVSPHLSRP